MKKLLPLFLLIFFTSCDDSGGDVAGILEPKKMQAVLWDLLVAGETADYFVNSDTMLPRDEQHLQRYGQVLSIHKISKPEFIKSLRWYQAHPDVFKPIVDSIHYQSIRTLNRSGGVSEP